MTFYTIQMRLKILMACAARVEDTGVVSMPGGGNLVQVFIQQFSGMLSFANKGKAGKTLLGIKNILFVRFRFTSGLVVS